VIILVAAATKLHALTSSLLNSTEDLSTSGAGGGGQRSLEKGCSVKGCRAWKSGGAAE